jgi:uncharacterized membrane protein
MEGCFMGLTKLDPLQRIAIMVYYAEYHGKGKERAKQKKESAAPSGKPQK